MYKNIPGNTELKISLDGKIIKSDGSECTLNITNEKVFINMFGLSKCVDITWLALVAHFKTEDLIDCQKNIWHITFTDTNQTPTKSISGKIMVFKRPIMVKKKYRVIPGFVKYAITRSGEILDVTKQATVSIKLWEDNSYAHVFIYDPEKNKYRFVPVHRLVALAWIPNDDYFEKPIVNHINGNKSNFHGANLEWVSYSENSKHAFETGLRTDNFECKIRDAHTDEITFFSSIREACRFMGINEESKLSSLQRKIRSNLIAEKYEIKLKTDNTPWFYEENKMGTKAGRYTLHVILPSGEQKVFTDLRTFIKDYKVWNVSSINDVIEKAERLYPGMKISYTDHFVFSPVEAYEIETGKIKEAASVMALSRMIQRNKTSIKKALMAGETRISQGFAYRYKTDKPWNTDFTEYECKSKCISATHQRTNEVLNFKSLRDVSKHFKIDRAVIKRHLDLKISFRSWIFKEVLI